LKLLDNRLDGEPEVGEGAKVDAATVEGDLQLAEQREKPQMLGLPKKHQLRPQQGLLNI